MAISVSSDSRNSLLLPLTSSGAPFTFALNFGSTKISVWLGMLDMKGIPRLMSAISCFALAGLSSMSMRPRLIWMLCSAKRGVGPSLGFASISSRISEKLKRPGSKWASLMRGPVRRNSLSTGASLITEASSTSTNNSSNAAKLPPPSVSFMANPLTVRVSA